MDCKTFERNISPYIDNQLVDIERKEFELHLLTCKECRKLYEEMINLVKLIREEEQEELPVDYKLKLREKLKEASYENKKKINWRVLSSVAAGFLILLMSYGLISNNFISKGLKEEFSQNDTSMLQKKTTENSVEISESSPEEEMQYSLTADVEEFAQEDDASESDKDLLVGELTDTNRFQMTRSGVYGRKLVKEAYIDLEIEDYNNLYEKIAKHVEDKDGYIENWQTGNNTSNVNDDEEEVSFRQGYIRIRIPEDKFQETLDFVKGLGVVIQHQITENDISEEYYSVENSVKNLRLEEDKLREILNEAKAIEDTIQIENELKRIRTEIDNNTVIIENWDNIVNLPVINANIIEVATNSKRINPINHNIWSKGKSGFVTTINWITSLFEKFLILILTISPLVIIIFLILLFSYILYKKPLSKRNKRI